MTASPKLSPTQIRALEQLRNYSYARVPDYRPFNRRTIDVLHRFGLIAYESGTQTTSYAPSHPNAVIKAHSASERITYARLTDDGFVVLEARG